MGNLTQHEQVIQEHICLYTYSVRFDKFRIFNDVMLIKNTMVPNKPLYYTHHYQGSDNYTKYFVLPDAGKVLHSGDGSFKVWLTEADDSAGVKLLLDAVDIYTVGKIEKAFNTITEMQQHQYVAHETLDCMM